MKNTAQDLLIEIGTEELPPKALKQLMNAFSNGIQDGLKRAELTYGAIETFATPRRLGILIQRVPTQQIDRTITRKGPTLSAAFDINDKPTPAALGFARSCGVEIEKLHKHKSTNGDWLYFEQKISGKKTRELLSEIILTAIAKLPIPKLMRWGNHDVEFARPTHWVLVVFGKQTISAKILNQTSSNKTYGHRFLHPKAIKIVNPNLYEKQLSKAFVVANYKKRKEIIRTQVQKIAKPKGIALINDNLLEEVTGLVEWPVALLGNFSKAFLEIPPEAVISAMNTHQKYFPILDKKGNLLPHFITISNIKSKNPKRVISGNERVLRARLADAEFFYKTDLKNPLAMRLEELKTVVFQQQLGNMHEKASRIAALATYLASTLNVNSEHAKQAGLLAKADLMTQMVGEFPELQGIMGYYYSLHDKQPEKIAIAIKEHYQPRFAGDHLPESPLGCAVALADKIDTVIGIFGINQAPTGDKDPFALRRAALGVLRIIIEKQIPIDLKILLGIAADNYQRKLSNANVVEQTLEFMIERLRAWYLEQDIGPDVFAAVQIRYPTQPLDFHRRIEALQHFQQLPEAKALAAANKRVSNILKQQASAKLQQIIDPKLFEHDSERLLAKLLIEKEQQVAAFYQKANYVEALSSLAALQKPVDQFFDEVMVMVEDEAIRNNRLTLLRHLRQLFFQIADISLLQ